MFRKIVSNLAFSPALVGQLGFYAKRLRKEEATRRIGLIFTVLALVVQSFAVFTPPDAANAASSTDFIYGGVSTMEQFLRAYDKNQGNLKDIFNYAGITRAEIVKTSLGTWKVDDTQSWGRKSLISAAQGEVKHVIKNSKGEALTTVYSRPQTAFFKEGARDYGWVGHSKKAGWFAIIKACANLATKKLPPPIPKPTAACSNLIITSISRTKYKLSGSAETKNGATISSYIYFVRNSKDALISKDVVNTAAGSSSSTITIDTPGTYEATLAVETSTGTKEGGNCRKNIKVSPPPTKDITVCDLTSKKIITIKDNAFDSKKHSKNLKDCEAPPVKKPPVKNIAVCELASKKIITIKENAFDSKLHSKNLKDCDTPAPVPTHLCLGTTVKQISRDTFSFTTDYSVKNATLTSITYTIKNASGQQLYKGTDTKYVQAIAGTYFVEATVTVDVNGKSVVATGGDCIASFTVEPEFEKVCVLATKTIESIDTNSFNGTLHSRNLKDCDDVIVPPCPVNPGIPSTSEECQTCPGDSTLWVKDERCIAQIIKTKSARNVTTRANATDAKVKAGESIEYTLTVRNDGTQESSADISDELSDVLEYADLINAGVGVFDDANKTLSWKVTSLAPGQELTFSYVVKMKDTIPAMAAGVSDRFSYDCRMVNTFGNSISLDVDCPGVKTVERVVTELPKTGPGMNMLVAGIATSIIVFFYARSKQLTKEVRLIRRDLNSGTI